MLQHDVFIKYRAGTSDARSWNLALIMRFASVETLRHYQRHPEHVKAMEFNQPCVDAVASVDFVQAIG